MAIQNRCIACQGQLEQGWKFCFKCGARVDDELMQEARSIDFILAEIKKWNEQMLISHYVEQKLLSQYFDRKNRIIESILPPKVEPIPEPRLIVENQPQEVSTPNPPNRAIRLNPVTIERSFANKKDSEESPIEQEPVVEQVAPARSFSELVAENIRTIFTICAALFVGGVVLYYRNEIYFGLKQPLNQAVLLAIVTLGSLITGWTLVRRTAENLAGRTLTLVGSLLVPVNPWFLVSSHLIPNTGNAWILGLACAGLYGWTAFFLRERFYVYLSLATAMLSGCAAVYKFTGGASASMYAVVMMSFSVIYLLVERMFKPEAEGIEFSRQEYGRPFFDVAQVGVALSLLFYTPLITLLPEEFVAAKYFFDPNSYNSLVTVWLALCGAFVYFYSGLTRRNAIFIYLSIASLLWSESALIYNLNLSFKTAILVFAATGLVANIVSHFSGIDQFYTRPLNRTAVLIGWGICLFSLFALISLFSHENQITSWRLITALLIAAAIFGLERIKNETRESFYAAGILISSVYLFSMLKIEIPVHFLGILMLLPVYGVILLSSRLSDRWKSLSAELQTGALIMTFAIILGSLNTYNTLIANKLYLSLLAAGIAGIFALSAIRAGSRESRLAQFSTSILFSIVSYATILKSFYLEKQTFALLMMLFPYLLIFLAFFLLKKQESSGYYSLLKDWVEPLKISAVILAIAGLCFWTPFENIIDYHKYTGVLLMLEYAGIFGVLSYATSIRSLSLAGFFITGLFLTASYSFVLYAVNDRYNKSEYALAAFGLWSMTFYGLSRNNLLRNELRASFSLISTIIAVILSLIACVGISLNEMTGVHQTHIAASIIITLTVLLFKEAAHLLSSRSVFHSTFAALIGIILLSALLNVASVRFETGLIWTVWLAIAYAGLSHLMRRRAFEQPIYYSIEIVGVLITISSLIFILSSATHDINYGLLIFLVSISATIFCALSAYLTGIDTIGKIYAYSASAALFISSTALFHHLGAANWAELSGLLIPLLALYLVAEFVLKGSVFAGTTFIIAQAALPIVVGLGIWSGMDLESTHLGRSLFFIEISGFYLLSAILKNRGIFLYPAMGTFSFAFGQLMLHLSIDTGYFMAFYSLFGLAFLLLSIKSKEGKFNWASTSLFNIANLLFVFSVSGAIIQSMASMSLLNSKLNPLVGSLLIIIAVGALSSTVSKNENLSRIYRNSTFLLSCFTYFVIGIRLGYDIIRQTEFYSIPVGTALLVAGYLGARKSTDSSGVKWLWAGSLLWTLPLLLHTLQFRFIDREPSTQHDISLLIISLVLIFGGIMLQLKAPTISGGAGFLIGMTVIVFGFVEWEQKWLSISMILLAVAIFGSSWIIYYFHKRNKLGQLSEQSRQVMEEFGKWK
jgi:hypothetical protein